MVCLPAWPYGVSTHRASFAATLNAGGRAFEDFWLGVIDVITARGFDPGVPKAVVSPESQALHARIVAELVALFRQHQLALATPAAPDT